MKTLTTMNLKKQLVKRWIQKKLNKKKSELKKLKFWINSDVVLFVTEAHKNLRLENSQCYEESIANRIVVSLPDNISSELSITCQNSD